MQPVTVLALGLTGAALGYGLRRRFHWASKIGFVALFLGLLLPLIDLPWLKAEGLGVMVAGLSLAAGMALFERRQQNLRLKTDPPTHRFCHNCANPLTSKEEDGKKLLVCSKCPVSFLDPKHLKTGRPSYHFCWNCATPLTTIQFEGKTKHACPNCPVVFWDNPLPVAGAIIPSGNGIVLIKRGVEPRIGKWALPAGYVDSFETPDEAVVRESKQEATIDITIDYQLCMLKPPNANQFIVFYVAKRTDQVPQPGSDATEAKVFPLDQLPEDIAFPLHRQVIEQYIASLPKPRRPENPASVYIREHYAELPVNNWVAVSKDGLVAHDADIEALNAKIAEKGIPLSDLTIAFIEPPAPAIVRQ